MIWVTLFSDVDNFDCQDLTKSWINKRYLIYAYSSNQQKAACRTGDTGVLSKDQVIATEELFQWHDM